jgi:Fe-S oxidoreductase
MRHPDYMQGCPSVARYHFHAYASGGKYNLALSLMKGRIDYTDGFLDALFKCQMDGSCDVSCKAWGDIEPLQIMQEMRIKCVQDGQGDPVHALVIEGLKKEDNMLDGLKADRGRWAEGLAVKDLTREKAEVAFHAGCRYSFDEELHPKVRGGLNLLLKAGVDVGILGQNEVCCGGRAYEMGYQGELIKYAEHNLETFRAAGVKTLVTPCSDCYQIFKVLYDKVGRKLDLEVLHITEYLYRMLQEGRIRFTRKVPLTVTYHDPCHLGRLAEPWVHWEGKEIKVLNQMICHDPPKKYRRGGGGVYDIPREILKSIPGLRLVEMYRIREAAWCCGAGGGVKEAFPEFALWTGAERLKEAKAVGAKALVSACPWCTRNFLDTVRETGDPLEILDLIDLVQEAI